MYQQFTPVEMKNEEMFFFMEFYFSPPKIIHYGTLTSAKHLST